MMQKVRHDRDHSARHSDAVRPQKAGYLRIKLTKYTLTICISAV